MRKKYKVIVVSVLLAGLIGYLGYRLYSLNEAHAALNEDFDKMRHRAELLQRKYTEQKAQTTALQRAKLTVEGQKRQAEMKAEELTAALAQKEIEMASLKKKVGTNVKTLEDRIANLDATIDAWKEKHKAVTEKYTAARKMIAQRDTTIARMEETVSQLQSDLQYATRTRDRYLKNNHQMAATAQSILARYDENGVFTETLLHVEPFTQIKKVELEKLIQAYLDRIDENVIRDRQ